MSNLTEAEKGIIDAFEWFCQDWASTVRDAVLSGKSNLIERRDYKEEDHEYVNSFNSTINVIRRAHSYSDYKVTEKAVKQMRRKIDWEKLEQDPGKYRSKVEDGKVW